MSIEIVQNAILDAFQKDAAFNAEFGTALTGTASSAGAAVTGTNTLFTTEVKVGDYIGTTAKGFRKVTAITDATHLTVKSAFDSVLATEAIGKTEIKKGLPKNINVTEVGKTARVAFVNAADKDGSVTTKVNAIYAFLVVIGFFENDADESEYRKSVYDNISRKVIDANPTFGGVCRGTTLAGRMNFAESPSVEGLYFGILSLVITRSETRGSR